jgi:hypothetical protein
LSEIRHRAARNRTISGYDKSKEEMAYETPSKFRGAVLNRCRRGRGKRSDVL